MMDTDDFPFFLSYLFLGPFPGLDWVGVVAHLLQHFDQLLLALVFCKQDQVFMFL